MKKLLCSMLVVVTFCICSAVSAGAVVNDMVKIGLRYGSEALFSANLENAVGWGYEFGYYDDERDFVPIGWTEETTISMTAAGTVYLDGNGNYSASQPSGSYDVLGSWHVQLDGFESFEEAQETAEAYGGWPAWIDGEYVVRYGCYEWPEEAELACGDFEEEAYAAESSATGVLVTVTRSSDILFEFDYSGIVSLGVLPNGDGEDALTWFKGYRYHGGFEYLRTTGGNISVINVVDIESYVKGVIPYEMSGVWPLSALEAQAVCARSYAYGHSGHMSSVGFDLCNTTDCQVYYGAGSSGKGPSERSDMAVENTAGECLYHNGTLVGNAVYHSSNGGATEDAVNVWGGKTAYLLGKLDPYEAMTSIPSYKYSVTYSAAELTWILQQKGYSIGTVKNAYISRYTATGNVAAVTFVDNSGRTLTVTGEKCRTVFYSSTYNKSVRSMRFEINGSSGFVGTAYNVNGGTTLSSLEGVYVISGDGGLTSLEGTGLYVITSEGTSALQAPGGSSVSKPAAPSDGRFTITGTGSGHNVGMSQYGAKAMAEAGYDYIEILQFYYTDVTVE